ncbi:protease SohB [Alkalimonas delamerensis]|uniref:Protease SohB n=1 Tax=Alkalimonas delamerensis TaxID=265981 RepID=A0ABT9GN25_9GAMM|nr:protease SohB [Alkalimonas delamerensis]MDP4528381.1 protease SohB [Alkalimonas delamerensis]
MEFLYDYGLFLAKAATTVFAIALVAGIIANSAIRHKPKKGEFQFIDLSDDFAQLKQNLKAELLDKKAFKRWQKEYKKLQSDAKNTTFVIDFHGSMGASEVDALREEVTAILAVAEPDDDVLVRLESGGGVVHGYGLGASQLDRLRQRKITLTVAVDKVAASGGYMMACIANRIIAAPFAIIGSIGVLAQLPNFHRLLQKNDIDFEQFTAGEYKRTVTLFGENTDKGREKFQQDLEQTHQLFKDHVVQHRDVVDVEQVATGEYWLASQALELKLVDALQTSDDFLLQRVEQRRLLQVKFQPKKKLAERVGAGASVALQQLWQKMPFGLWGR